MLAFVEQKRPDYDWIREQLAPSEAAGMWANFGPASLRLEEEIAAALDVPPTRSVVACASGTAALYALVQLHAFLAGKPLRWAVCAFTFYAQRQGPLADAVVIDCDRRGYLDLAALAAADPSTFDGVIVTNLFGTATGADHYEAFGRRAGKVVLFDSATCFGSRGSKRPIGSLGDGELISFHHTKPCGFGEGGAAIVPRAQEDALRSMLNFGLYKGVATGHLSGNGKMSDVAAAFILDRIRHRSSLQREHLRQWRRTVAIGRALGCEPLVDDLGDAFFPNLTPLVCPRDVGADRLPGRAMALLKYYRPVAPRPAADALYRRVVCLPNHPGVAALDDATLTATIDALVRAGD
jgi:dTDP-4-amino-4,6-dideoxygalactose transaminase